MPSGSAAAAASKYLATLSVENCGRERDADDARDARPRELVDRLLR